MADSLLNDAVSFLLSRCRVRPRVGLILGSGLGGIADAIEEPEVIPYGDIPGFPCTTVPGHAGKLVLGTMEGVGIAAMKGRPHLYEGYTPGQLGYPVQVLGGLGVRLLVVTNAAGGLNPDLERGTLMIVEDHVGLPTLSGLNPLAGVDGGEERFVNMAAAYDERLRLLVQEVAREAGIPVASGVYAMVAGPSYETAAEVRLLRQLGADAVGMSTVAEVIVARWLGMKVLGVSCITNVHTGFSTHGEIGHLDVVTVASRAVPNLSTLLRGLINGLPVMSDE